MDALIILGSHNLRVAHYGATLFKNGWIPLIMVTGGQGKITKSWWKSEAYQFAQILKNYGIPQNKVLLEEKSSNTGENILFVKKLMDEKKLNLKKILVIDKPYKTRRDFLAFKKQWPQIDVHMSTYTTNLQTYLSQVKNKEQFYHLMMGDLHRIMVYPEIGYQEKVEIPKDVRNAFEEMVKLGYDKYLYENML